MERRYKKRDIEYNNKESYGFVEYFSKIITMNKIMNNDSKIIQNNKQYRSGDLFYSK